MKGALTLHTGNAPSGRIVSMALEELGLAYDVVPVDLATGEQRRADFLALNPNGKIPVLRDGDLVIAESGPILQHLAALTGRLLPADPAGRFATLQWMSWAASGLGPTVVQLHHFGHFAPGTSDYARDRFAAETQRHYGTLDRRLEGRDFIAGPLSLADFAAWPWVARFQWQGIDLAAFPAVRRWYRAMAARPSVARGYHVPAEVEPIPMPQ